MKKNFRERGVEAVKTLIYASMPLKTFICSIIPYFERQKSNMWTVSNKIMGLNEEKRENGPTPKNQKKVWNLVVSKTENRNLRRKTAKTTTF